MEHSHDEIALNMLANSDELTPDPACIYVGPTYPLHESEDISYGLPTAESSKIVNLNDVTPCYSGLASQTVNDSRQDETLYDLHLTTDTWGIPVTHESTTVQPEAQTHKSTEVLPEAQTLDSTTVHNETDTNGSTTVQPETDTHLTTTDSDVTNTLLDPSKNDENLPGSAEKPALIRIVPGTSERSKATVYFCDGQFHSVGHINKESVSKEGLVSCTVSCAQAKKSARCSFRFRMIAITSEVRLMDYETYAHVERWSVVENTKRNQHSNLSNKVHSVVKSKTKDAALKRLFCDINEHQWVVKDFNARAVQKSLAIGRSIVRQLKPEATNGPTDDTRLQELLKTLNARNKNRISRQITYALEKKTNVVFPQHEHALNEKFFCDGERLDKIKHISEQPGKRILLLTTTTLLNILADAKKVSLDCTFSAARSVHYGDTKMAQILTFSTSYGEETARGYNNNICCAFLYLPDARTETYMRGVDIIQERY